MGSGQHDPIGKMLAAVMLDMDMASIITTGLRFNATDYGEQAANLDNMLKHPHCPPECIGVWTTMRDVYLAAAEFGGKCSILQQDFEELKVKARQSHRETPMTEMVGDDARQSVRAA